MPDAKITALASIGTGADPANDPLVIVDVSDTTMAASGTTKKLTINQILGASGTATLASATITGNLAVQTNALFVNSANNRVGILTTSPAYAFDVAGLGNFTQLRVSSNAATSLGLVNTTSGLTYTLYSANTASNGFNGFGILDGSVYVLRINSNGALVLTGGTVAASGVGIAFPATQVASSDANTLDDYEEGTWTPVVIGTTTNGVGTYTNQVGFYTKIGNLVTVQAYITWTAHTATGNMRLSGLPFANSSTAGSFSAVCFGFVNNLTLTAGNILTGFTSVGNTFIDCFQTPTGGGASTSVPIDTAAELIYTVTYRV